MTLKVCESTGGLVRSGDPVHQRTLGIVSSATVGAGTLGFALSKTVDASCHDDACFLYWTCRKQVVHMMKVETNLDEKKRETLSSCLGRPGQWVL